ncbi:putative NADH dehydrogenase 22K chain precursor, partial [Mrakia frigida]|uniref:coiled-coil-helix-coiled-coil-helix domain-containing protein n=1 Tax=Mrakia frigida TaxID=29902 RepID=UPI003FCBF08E
KHVPHVAELGITSAPLKSASFLMGTYCKDYTEDFMLCRGESQDPAHCLQEGRRVTRCGTDFINQMRDNCGQVFAAHWQCLDRRNQMFEKCRNAEKRMNACAEEKLGLKKVLPGAQGVPVHLRDDKDLYHKSYEE